MNRHARSLIAALLAAVLAHLPARLLAAETPDDDPVLSAMRKELERSFSALQNAEKTPLYFLGYQIRDTRSYHLDALLGAIRSENDRRHRFLDVDVRVGSRKLDNTHQIKGAGSWLERSGERHTEVTVDDDGDALRADIWRRTDKAFKEAFRRYTKVVTNKAVTAEEEDKSWDFSEEKPARFYEKIPHPEVDKNAWRERLRRISATFKKYPFIIDTGVSLSVDTLHRYMVNSEGAEIVTGDRYIRLSYRISARTDDGMDLDRFRSYDADRLEDLPGEAAIIADMERSAAELQALHKAPLVEPFNGPAIFRNRATGVYFHEILGHRLEGHRQKLEEEGQTFTKKLDKLITAPFITVYDDPKLDRFRGQFLRGAYRYDDEGVASRRVDLILRGKLKAFLMSRSPIERFGNSNGHGRRSAGHEVVARMGNLIVKSRQRVSSQRLREMLIEEIRKQGKPYGLIFEDIAGGFTSTSRHGTQSFKVIPKLVYRVYPDGRPDEAVRGVDIVGTPLTAFTKIIGAGDDPGVFNGTCGAESGWVPVSAVAPSILVSEIEVEKKFKSSDKPPVLSPPHHEKEDRP
ncbi:MAG: metallopeptidase TldD-related protein [Elusimicrobiota bacterium]